MAGIGVDYLRHGDDVVLTIEDLVVEYASRRASGKGKVHAVSGVSFDVLRGETLGLVGESGCGKSTTGRAAMMLSDVTAGRVLLEGRDLSLMGTRELRRTRRRIHMIFQDPTSSLNARRTVRDIVGEGLSIGRVPKPWDERVDRAIQAVGLDPTIHGGRRPSQLSGGQCQRVAIARALAIEPALLICDEPVSALDVSVQAQILNLLEDMKSRFGLTLIFISHDLAVVKNISDRVAVMYLGRLCEVSSAEALWADPQHPYTQALLSSVPHPDPSRCEDAAPISGDLPSPLSPPSGCRFRTRCPRATDRCAAEQPELTSVGDDHYVACHYPGPLAWQL